MTINKTKSLVICTMYTSFVLLVYYKKSTQIQLNTKLDGTIQKNVVKGLKKMHFATQINANMTGTLKYIVSGPKINCQESKVSLENDVKNVSTDEHNISWKMLLKLWRSPRAELKESNCSILPWD